MLKAVELLVGKKSYSALTYDIGQGGVACIVDKLLSPGQVVLKMSDPPLAFFGQIVGYCSAGNPGLYRYQIKFEITQKVQVISQLLQMQEAQDTGSSQPARST